MVERADAQAGRPPTRGPSDDPADAPARLIREMAAHRRAGRALPGGAYTDPGLYRRDLDRVFFRQWLFAGHACDIPDPGDYFLFEVADESLIVVRDESGAIRAHANVCRHRGSRICTAEAGRAQRLVCPYHQWTYRLDGTLSGARLMGRGFEAGDFPLRAARVRDVEGMIFVCLADRPPDFDLAWETIAAQVRMNRLAGARVCGRFDYTIRANWKVVVENNRECYHCPGGHPEFCLSNFDVGVNGDVRENRLFDQARRRSQEAWRRLGLPTHEVNFPGGAGFRVARFPLKDGYLTESLDGGTVAPLMGAVPEPGIGSLRIIVLPNCWIHVNCDYAVTTRLTPVDAETTRARVAFLVDGRAEPGVDFDAERVAAVWRATSEQDWRLCERTQAGVRSRSYEAGPYSPLVENSVAAFVDWYLAQVESVQI